MTHLNKSLSKVQDCNVSFSPPGKWNKARVADEPKIDENLPTLVYNHYNLDPLGHKDSGCNRILLLEPEIIEAYPISQKVPGFDLKLGEDISGLQVYAAYFDEVHFKEHPLNSHYMGTSEERDRMTPLEGNFRSFFAFWKKASKHLNTPDLFS